MEKKLLHFMTPVRILVMSYLGVVFLGFILLSFPLATPGEGKLSAIDALFTSASATCVTGLTVVSTRHELSLFGQLVVLLQLQLGGLGVMTFSTMFALLLGRKISLRGRLLIREDLNQSHISGLIRLIKYVLLFTIVIQGAGTVLLWASFARFMDWGKSFYYAVFHAASAFNNAGFDIFGNSLADFGGDFSINLIFIVLIVLGGIGFAVLVEFIHRQNKKRFSLGTRTVLYITLLLLVSGTVVIGLLEWNNPDTLGRLPVGQRIMASLFLSVTARTAGFNTVETNLLGVQTLFFVVLLMFIGASPGSTGGGIKTTTFGVLIFAMRARIMGMPDVEMMGRRLDEHMVLKAFTIASMALFLVTLVTFFLSILEEAPFMALLFEATSAFGTVGLSTGITPELSTASKAIIIVTMLMGRVGLMSFGLALGMRRQVPKRRLPEDQVIVG